MKKFQKRAFCAMALAAAALSVQAAEQVKEAYHPTVNGSPVTLIKDNLITQKLGGRVVNLDVYAGEFIRYDSNIYGSEHDKVDDTVFTTAAGALLQAGEKDRWNARVEGQALYNAYASHDEYNGTEGFVRADGAFVVSPALTLRGKAGYSRNNDNSRSLSDVFHTTRYHAGVGATVSANPFFAVDVDYLRNGVRRDYRNLAEYDADAFTIRPSYAVTPNTRLYVLGGYETADVRTGRAHDTDTTSVAFGAAWNYRDDARLFGEVGFAYMDFDTNGSADRAGEDKTLPTVRFGGDLALNADVKLAAQFSYAPSIGAVSTSAGNSAYIETTAITGSVIYSPGAGRFTATASPFLTFNDPSNDVKYREAGVSLGTTYCVKEWVNVSAGYRYTNTKYDDASAYDRHAVMLGLALTM